MQAPHGFYKKLVANGFTAEQAEGLTEAHTEFFSEILEKETKLIKVDFKSELATKNDVQDLKNELEKFATKDDVQSVKNELKDVKNELEKFATKEDLKNELEKFATKDDIQNLKNELKDVKNKLEKFATKDDVQSVKEELKSDVQSVKEELKSDVQDVKKDLHRLELGLVEVQGTLKWFKWLLLSIFAVQVFPLLKTFFENLF